MSPSSVAEIAANSESLQDRAMRWGTKDADENSHNLTACRIKWRQKIVTYFYDIAFAIFFQYNPGNKPVKKTLLAEEVTSVVTMGKVDDSILFMA